MATTALLIADPFKTFANRIAERITILTFREYINLPKGVTTWKTIMWQEKIDSSQEIAHSFVAAASHSAGF